MHSETLHRTSPITAERAGFDKIVLPDVFVLEMSPHGNLALEAPVADRTVVRQGFGMGSEVLGEMVLAEEPLLANTALVRFDAGVAHLVSTHVGAVGELHVADVALEHLAVYTVGGRVIVLHLRLVLGGGGGRTLCHVCGQSSAVGGLEIVTASAFKAPVA